MKEQTVAERKRIATLDKRIERLRNEVDEKQREYDAAAEKLTEALYERYPERKTERIKDELNCTTHTSKADVIWTRSSI